MESTTYNKIITAATSCFSKKGFYATSIADIAHQAGMSQGAMYRHFRGKEELIIAIVKEEADRAVAFYSAPYECTALERIYQLAKSCIMKNGSPITASLWIEIIAESAKNQEVNKYYLAADTAMRDALKQIIKKGLSDGEFQSIEAEEASIVLFAILDGLIARRAIQAKFDIEQSLPSLEKMLLALLNPSQTPSN